MSKIKVLMVAGSMHVGGIENQLMHLTRNIDRNQFQIDFTSDMPEAFYREEIESLGSEFHLIPRMSWKNPIPYITNMYRIMKDGKYDIVHSHELFHSGITLAIARFAGVPCRFVHAHNWCDDDGTGKKTSVIRKMYNKVMQILINANSTSQIACSTWAGKFLYGAKMQQKDSYHLVFNSVDTTKFVEKYNDIESGEFCDDDWINVINVARVNPVKNQLFLLKMAYELKKRGQRVRILCVGNGAEDYIEMLNQKIEKYKLQDYFKLLGVRKDIDVLERKSKVFILPSHYEGMPLVMIEAQASGLQCISADTYSPEVDFEIGTVTWLPLKDGYKKWTDVLLEVINRDRADESAVRAAITKKNFDSRMFAKIMSDLYIQDYQMRSNKQ